MASNDPERREEEIGDTAACEDEDTGAQIPPIFRLEKVTINTGEEGEDVLLDLKAKANKKSIQYKDILDYIKRNNCPLFMETPVKQDKPLKKIKFDAVTRKFKKLSIGKDNSEKKVVEEEIVTSDSNEKEDEKEKEEKAETKIQMTSNVPERRGEEISDITTGEDKVGVITEEDCNRNDNFRTLLDLKAKLYYFDEETIKWKVRGMGSVKILKRSRFDIRIVMQQCQTKKICAQQFIRPFMKLQKHSENAKSCLWHALDFSEEELKHVTFSIWFTSVDNRKLFIETVRTQAELYEMNMDKKHSKYRRFRHLH